MPTLNSFLHGFGIHQGLQVDGYLLSNIEGKHEQIVRYREYQYPIELTFVPQHSQVNYQELISKITQITSGTNIISTRYGNPYECNIDTPQIVRVYTNGTVIVGILGHSYRIFK
jgi:hypothetical protein